MDEAAVPGVSAGDNGSGENTTLSPPLASAEVKPTTSKGVPETGPAALRRSFHISLCGQLYPGVIEASKRGVHPVIRYPIPGGEFCYAFEQVRTTKQGLVVYRCTKCKKSGTTTSIAVQNGCEFIGDPASLPHVCTPLKNAQDKVTRMVYQSCQAIATDPQLAQAKPSQLWKSIAQFIDDNAPNDEAERKMMLKHFYRSGYKSRRRTIARAAAKLHESKLRKGSDTRDDATPKVRKTAMKNCSS
ncbi:hypothetical protein V3C99_012227 [Haemonchus contortus]